MKIFNQRLRIVAVVAAVAVSAVLLSGCKDDGAGLGDGSYDYVELGGLKWMTKNMNIATDSSCCYDNDPANCRIYGRMYTWAAAVSVCQSVGWRLPDTADWNRLVEAAGGASVAGKKLKSTSGWKNNGNGTDDFGFSGLPGGGRWYYGSFINLGEYGDWWTATEYNSKYAYDRHMWYDRNSVDNDDDDKGDASYVRCVQDY